MHTTSSFDELQEKEILSQFITEIIKDLLLKCIRVKDKIVPKLMFVLFQETEYPYNLGNDHTLEYKMLKLYTMGLKLSFMAPKI